MPQGQNPLSAIKNLKTFLMAAILLAAAGSYVGIDTLIPDWSFNKSKNDCSKRFESLIQFTRRRYCTVPLCWASLARSISA
jgi:hypothetical protein